MGGRNLQLLRGCGVGIVLICGFATDDLKIFAVVFRVFFHGQLIPARSTFQILMMGGGGSTWEMALALLDLPF